jgi:tetratricopeptide (TPR) repeat protein
MKRVLAILAGVAIVCAVAYLVAINETHVDFHYTPSQRFEQVHLVTLLVFAFIAGVLLVLAGVLVQAGRRSLTTWGRSRRERKDTRIDQWEERGEQLVWQGDAQHGRALLQRAWHRRPTNPYAVLALAESYRDTGEFERALGLLSDAAQRHHTHPDVLFALAETQRAAGDRAAALATLERLRALHPHAARALRALRDAYVDAGRWTDAAALQEVLVAAVHEPDLARREREFLGRLRYQAAIHLSDAAARVRALEALADGRSVPPPVLTSLGDALRDAGRIDEASILWERELRSVPRTVLVERLMNLATEPQHRERLRTLLSKLRGDQVQLHNVRLLVAQLYVSDGLIDEAARILDSLEHPVDQPLVHRLWADIHRRRGHLDQAVAAFSRVDGPLLAYRCTTCGYTAREWIAYCPHCAGWDSYRSTVEIAPPAGR